MKSLIKDERADSMVIFVIAAGILLFGFVYILLTYSHNFVIVEMNSAIVEGTVSKDTATHFQTMNQMWQASPYFFLVGLILFCFERMKGESVSSDTYFGYLMLMIVTLVISMYMVWAFGTSTDMMITMFENNEIFMTYGPEFDVTGAKQIFIALIYYATMFPGFIGSILYMIHPILKQRENTFLDNPPSNDGEYVTDYSIEQM